MLKPRTGRHATRCRNPLAESASPRGNRALKALFRNGPPGQNVLHYGGELEFEAVRAWCKIIADAEGVPGVKPQPGEQVVSVDEDGQANGEIEEHGAEKDEV